MNHQPTADQPAAEGAAPPGKATCQKCARIDAAVAEVRRAVARHPHFSTRAGLIHVFRRGDEVIVSACVPTYFLKQTLVQLARATVVDGVVVDEVGVATGHTCDEAPANPQIAEQPRSREESP